MEVREYGDIPLIFEDQAIEEQGEQLQELQELQDQLQELQKRYIATICLFGSHFHSHHNDKLILLTLLQKIATG